MIHEPALPDDVPAETRQRLRELLHAGQWREAIRVGSALPQQDRGATLERDIVNWRLRAFAEGATASPPDWPPATPAPDSETFGIVEITPDALTPQRLADGVLRHGCLLVRGLFDAEECARLRTCVDTAMQALQTFTAHPEAPPTSPWYARFHPGQAQEEHLSMARSFVEDAHALLAADSPRSLAQILSIFEAHGIVPLLEAYFGERPALSVLKTTLRRVPPSQDSSGWHQDGKFIGTGIRSMNLWLALSDCGADASGLDIVPRRFDHIVETGTDDALLSWTAGQQAVLDAAGPAGIATPTFAPGDALFFDHMLMHRTSLPPGRTRSRYAIESWFFAPTDYPMAQIPLWV